nr:hypothetical protein [Verticiella sp. GG226]
MNTSTLKAPALRLPRAPRWRRLGLGLVVPVAILLLWQWVGMRPGMAGIMPTPVQVPGPGMTGSSAIPAWG